jgi:hypothetical protein
MQALDPLEGETEHLLAGPLPGWHGGEQPSRGPDLTPRRVAARRVGPVPQERLQVSPAQAGRGGGHPRLHAADRLVRGGRRRDLKIQATWPWAEAITAAWQRIDALPQAP